MSSPTVLVATNHQMMWRALRSVAAAAGLGPTHAPRDRHLLDAAQQTRPAVLALDVLDVAPVATPEEIDLICQEVDRSLTDSRVLLIADVTEHADIVHMARCGVHGVFTPDTSLGLFPAAIAKVAQGEAWFSRSQVGSLVAQLSAAGTAAPSVSPAREKPTPRETDVLALMYEGCGHAQIADRLGCSPHTARTHIRNVMRKLRVHSRNDAVRVALRNGLISPGDGSGAQW